MNSDQELNKMKERLNRIEHKVDKLASDLQQQQSSPGRRLLIGFGITMVVILLLLMGLGIFQFISAG